MATDFDSDKETYEAHRARDEKTWGGLFLISWLFPGTRWLLVPLAIAVGGIWLINVLGNSGALIDAPERYYVNRDPVTGETKTTKGCRAERLLPDGTCDKSISIDIVRQSVPFFGDGKNAHGK